MRVREFDIKVVIPSDISPDAVESLIGNWPGWLLEFGIQSETEHIRDATSEEIETMDEGSE